MPTPATRILPKLTADPADVGGVPMTELRQRLGEFLSLDGPAPEEVVRRALADPGFEADLITSRGAPGFLRALFDHPRTRAYAAPGGAAAVGDAAGGLAMGTGGAAPAGLAPGPVEPCRVAPATDARFPGPATAEPGPGGPAAPAGVVTNRELVAKAAGAFARWGRSGFAAVDVATIERREVACLSCPYLTDPQAAAQKVAAGLMPGGRIGARTGRKVCGKCGCLVSRKIRMATESCPDAHPQDPALTRWGEPAASAQDEGGERTS